MALTQDEERFVKRQHQAHVKKIQMANLEKAKWLAVKDLMATTTDGTQWQKRFELKQQYNVDIDLLNNEIKILGGWNVE